MKLKIFAAFMAACVMAVGLYGQAEEPEIYYSDFFDTYSVGDTISNMNDVVKANMQTTSYLGTWSSGEADMTKIANDGNNYLALDTAGDVVTNTLISAGEINDVLSGGGEVSFATGMKLIPSDEIESSFVDAFDAEGNPAIVDNGDLKFGLYAYEYDVTKIVDGAEVPEVVTNLVVYHSYYKYDSATGKTGIGYTNNVIELKDSNGNPISFAGEIPVVTTLKMLAGELYFSVSITGSADEITSSLGCTDDAFTEEKLAITVCPSVDGGKWFRCVHVLNGNNSTISALNLSGTGNVRSIELSAVEGEGGGEGGGDTEEIVLSWNEFAGFADTTVGETATANVTFNLSGANDATVTIEGEAFAIADQPELGKVTVTFKPTEAKEYTATLTVIAGDKSATLSITGTGVAPEPTVIKLVKLNVTGDMVNGSAPTFTATVTDSEGNTVDASNYTIDASAINMTKAGLYPVIITATGDLQGVITNYYAVMSPTWFNGTPTQKMMLTNAYIGLGGGAHEGSHWMRKSENGRFLAINHQAGNAGTGCKALSLYELATLTNLYGVCYSHWEFAQCIPSGGAYKGVAVNEAAGLVTLGNVDASPTVGSSYDIDDVSNKAFGTQSSYAFIKNGATVTLKHDSPAFSPDGTYLYVNNYNPSSSRNIISKFSVDKANNQFVWVQDYVGSVSRIRSLEVYAIDGRDYVFYGEGGGSLTGNIYAMDTVTGESTLVCSALESSVFANDGNSEVQLVRISGIASGEMYLYAHSDQGTIVVWALRHDVATGAWNTALVREFTQAEYLALCDEESLGYSRNLEVSDDNQYGFILPHNTYDARLIVVSDVSLAQRKALASATLSPASSDKDVELGALTATVLDENGDTVDASEYTINTDTINIAEVGEYTVTITPVEGSVYSNAVTAVYMISAPSAAGFNDPEGNAITDTTLLAWLTSKGATQAQIDALGSAAALNEKYLLNIDLVGSSYSLKIKSLTVGDDVKVEVDLVRSNATAEVSAAINGKLQLWGTADLGTDFADCGLTEISNDDFSNGTTAEKSFTPAAGVKFFKAVIVAPTAAE